MNAALMLTALLATGAPDALREAAERYAKGDAGGAADAYETAIAQGANSDDVYFNLGTAALRSGDMGRAVWALMEARRINPWDDDVLFNLALAHKESPDTLVGLQEPAWLSTLMFVPRAALQWFTYALFLLLCGLLTARGLKGPSTRLERWALRSGVLLFVLGVFTATVEMTVGAPSAVVMVKELSVRSTDRKDGPEAFKVHAGLVVRPVGEPRAGMLRIRLANGLEGYAEETSIRRVGIR